MIEVAVLLLTAGGVFLLFVDYYLFKKVERKIGKMEIHTRAGKGSFKYGLITLLLVTLAFILRRFSSNPEALFQFLIGT